MNENNNWFLESMQSQLHDLYNQNLIFYHQEFSPHQLEPSGSVKSNPTTPQNTIKNSWDTTEKI
jgi:hypothetical protein